MISIHTFELTMESKCGYDKWYPKKGLPKDDCGVPTDYSLFEDGLSIKFDDRHRKRIRLIVNPSRVLGGDDVPKLLKPNKRNVTKLIDNSNELLSQYFSGDYDLNDFTLTRIDFTANINVGNQETVSGYIKALHGIGKVKKFSPKYSKQDYYSGRIDKDNSFDLIGNSENIEFTAYDKQAQLEQLADRSRYNKSIKNLKHRINMAEGILRVEVRIAGVITVRNHSGKEIGTKKQIKFMSENCEDIFMGVFQHIVPRGDYYRKNKAEQIIAENVLDRTMRNKMLRLLDLIPEKKSLLLAQKALDDRNIGKIMKKFAEIDLSPVTLSKRHDFKRLDGLYSYLE